MPTAHFDGRQLTPRRDAAAVEWSRVRRRGEAKERWCADDQINCRLVALPS
jgi:hypothetical protein